MGMFIIIGALMLFAGLGVGFYIARTRQHKLEYDLSSASNQVTQIKAEVTHLTATKEELSNQLHKVCEDLASVRGSSAKDAESLSDAKKRIGELETKLLESSVERSELNTRLEEQAKRSVEDKNHLALELEQLANQILETTAEKFTSQNQHNINQVLSPLKERLTELQARVDSAYLKEMTLASKVEDLTSLNQTLSEETRHLTSALKGSSKAQGDWGQIVLERILEDSGLRRDIDFQIQTSFYWDDGTRGIPDVVLNLPEGKHIIIDAKVSLPAYMEFVAAQSDDARAVAIDKLILSLRNHIKGLSNQQYEDLEALNSPDFVFMFIPSEAAFALLLSRDPQIWHDANRKKVHILGPTTLLYALKTVADLLRAETQRRNIAEIVKAAADLYDKFFGFFESVQEIGKGLDKAQQNYEVAIKRIYSGSGSYLKRVEHLKKYGVSPKKTLPAEYVEDEIVIPMFDDEVETQEPGKIRSIAAGSEE